VTPIMFRSRREAIEPGDELPAQLGDIAIRDRKSRSLAIGEMRQLRQLHGQGLPHGVEPDDDEMADFVGEVGATGDKVFVMSASPSCA